MSKGGCDKCEGTGKVELTPEIIDGMYVAGVVVKCECQLEVDEDLEKELEDNAD